VSDLKPKCVDPGIAPAYVSSGHILPCCYIDGELNRDPAIDTLFARNLMVDRNEDITDIFTSEEWINFFDMLINRPEEAPKLCKMFCGRKNMNNTNAMTTNRYTLTGTYYGKGIDARE